MLMKRLILNKYINFRCHIYMCNHLSSERERGGGKKRGREGGRGKERERERERKREMQQQKSSLYPASPSSQSQPPPPPADAPSLTLTCLMPNSCAKKRLFRDQMRPGLEIMTSSPLRLAVAIKFVPFEGIACENTDGSHRHRQTHTQTHTIFEHRICALIYACTSLVVCSGAS
jgi:hypothetical protein